MWQRRLFVVLWCLLLGVSIGCGVKKSGKPLIVPVTEPNYQKSITDQYEIQKNEASDVKVVPWIE